jgi:formamidopyrimidine-DNA glycosylase
VPELPDVEGFRRFYSRHAEGRAIVRVEVPDPALVRNRSRRSLVRMLVGRRFGPGRRHGKWLIIALSHLDASSQTESKDAPELLMHFGMTGALAWSDNDAGRHRHDRLIFVCEGGELRYNNMRRFGGVWLAGSPRERGRITGPLGPDAAELAFEQFAALMEARRGGAKAALIDQSLLAGIGNLMSDEILWRARIDPRSPVQSLDKRRRRRMYEALRAVVSESSRYGRVPHGERWLTRVRDDRAARCPRCGNRLRRARIAGRTACWCGRCQR